MLFVLFFNFFGGGGEGILRMCVYVRTDTRSRPHVDCTHLTLLHHQTFLPQVLTRGYDWQGNVCEGATPVFMPLNIKTMGVCLPACPKTYEPETVYCIGDVDPTEANINVRERGRAGVVNGWLAGRRRDGVCVLFNYECLAPLRTYKHAHTTPHPKTQQAGYCLPQYPTKEVMNRCYITNTTALELYDMVKAYKDQVRVHFVFCCGFCIHVCGGGRRRRPLVC